MFYNARDTAERYSATETVREGVAVYLGAGSRLLSNRRRPMLDITANTVGRHDTLGGACSAESSTVQYGFHTRRMHFCRDSFVLAIMETPEFRLSKRDLTHNVNFFMNVPVTQDGGLTFEDGVSSPEYYIGTVAAMDLIVLISVSPQPNKLYNGYDPTPLETIIWSGA